MKYPKTTAMVLVVACAFAHTLHTAPGAPLSPLTLLRALAEPCAAHAEEAWRTEFDEICSKTEGSMTLTKEELRELIARGEKLKTVIETFDESKRKVYLKRLQMCVDLYKYLYEVKENQ